MKKCLVLTLFVLSILNQFAQTITLTFNGKDAINQSFISLDSVRLVNQTIGCDTIIYGAIPSVTIPFLVGIDEARLATKPVVLLNAPNPFNTTTNLHLYLPRRGHLTMWLSDNLGSQTAEYTKDHDAGVHKFQIRAGASGMLLLNILFENEAKLVKLINTSSRYGNNEIVLVESTLNRVEKAATAVGFEYYQGNVLTYTAMAEGYINRTQQDSPVADTAYTLLLTPLATLATVTTGNITTVAPTTAVGGGHVTSDGNSPVTARGVCWSTDPSPTTVNSHTVDGMGIGQFTSNLTGLSPTTTYHVRAYATNGEGTAYGNEYTFTTLQPVVLPTVTTTPPANIAQTTATSGGIVTGDGGGTVTARGVCWAATPNPMITDSHTLDGSGPGTFVSNISGLSIGTHYYLRAYATNSAGTAYGEEFDFTTTITWICGDVLIDSRDGKQYNTVLMGSQCWMAQNLNIGNQIASNFNQSNNGTIEKFCYSNSAANCETFGGLYQWAEMMNYATNPGAKGICPDGWHIPSIYEWEALTTYVSTQPAWVCGSSSSAIGKALASITFWTSYTAACTVGFDPSANNATGFNAQPAGFRWPTDPSFNSLYKYIYFWTSTGFDDQAYYREIGYNKQLVQEYWHEKLFGQSVRCLKDN